MSLFQINNSDKPSADTNSGRTIRLSFSGVGSKIVSEIASQTLKCGGLDAATVLPQIREKMPDGTVYAGVSPNTGNPMYTTPADEPIVAFTFNEAARQAGILNVNEFLGHDDWRVPTKDELSVLFNNRAAIGGFEIDDVRPSRPWCPWYLSASPGTWKSSVLCQRFNDGVQADVRISSVTPMCVRYVR